MGQEKKEGWLGVALTVVLCLGFLYWWFRPERRAWEQESASQLVTRAMAEPRPASRVELQVIDFDLMEVTICQGSTGMLEEAVATAKHIRDPRIKRQAVRQLAQAFLRSHPQDFGEAIGLADLLSDPAARAEVRTEVLGQLAVLGFADAALPEAKTALQKAVLARRMAATDGQEKARELLAEAEKELTASLNSSDAVKVREHIAGARINLTPVDGAQPAIAAIKALPAERQPAFWEELSDWCDGEKFDLRTLMPEITDPALRRKLEVESLLFVRKPWPASELTGKYRAEAESAATPEAKITAMISLAEAQRNSGEPDTTAAATTANETLLAARPLAATIGDAASRCRVLLELTKRLNLALLFDEAKDTLEETAKTARSVQPLGARAPLLIAAAEENFLQARPAEANALIMEAAAEAEAFPPGAAPLQTIAVAVVRRGDWPRGLALADRIPDESARLAALEALAEAASEQSFSVDFADPPPRGEPVDGIRLASSGDQARAADLVAQQPAGYARTRAWLAMARGLIIPPSNLNDYMAKGSQPGESEPEPLPAETP